MKKMIVVFTLAWMASTAYASDPTANSNEAIAVPATDAIAVPEAIAVPKNTSLVQAIAVPIQRLWDQLTAK